MSFRLQQHLAIESRSVLGGSPLQTQIMGEMAITLGLAGKRVERSLAALSSCSQPSLRSSLVQKAADAVHDYLIQREMCGLIEHRAVIETYRVPSEVMARVGAR